MRETSNGRNRGSRKNLLRLAIFGDSWRLSEHNESSESSCGRGENAADPLRAPRAFGYELHARAFTRSVELNAAGFLRPALDARFPLTCTFGSRKSSPRRQVAQSSREPAAVPRCPFLALGALPFPKPFPEESVEHELQMPG